MTYHIRTRDENHHYLYDRERGIYFTDTSTRKRICFEEYTDALRWRDKLNTGEWKRITASRANIALTAALEFAHKGKRQAARNVYKVVLRERAALELLA